MNNETENANTLSFAAVWITSKNDLRVVLKVARSHLAIECLGAGLPICVYLNFGKIFGLVYFGIIIFSNKSAKIFTYVRKM